MTINELKNLRAAVATSEIDTDTALDALVDEYEDEISDWGFDNTGSLGLQIAQHKDDLWWLHNFIDNADSSLTWHYLDGYGWVDDNGIRSQVIDLIDDLLANEED